MDVPNFTLDVSYYPTAFGSWSLTAMHAPDDELSPPPNLILDEEFSYEWGFTGEQIPGQLDPGRVSFVIAAESIAAFGHQPGDEANLWLPQRGERMSFALRVGVGGEIIASSDTMRITDARLVISDTDPEDDPHPVKLSVSAVDQLLELPLSVYSGDGTTERRATLDRLAEMASLAGCSIGLPDTLSRVQSVAARFTKKLPERFRDGLTTWANSQTVDELRALVATPYDRYGAFRNDGVSPTPAYPTGYSWCGPSNPVIPAGHPALVDPATDLKVMLTPANPKTALIHKLPLRFTVVDGLLTLTNAPAADDRMPAVDAAYCDLPTTLRSSREHAPNTFLVAGDAEWLNVTPTPDVYETRDLTIEVAVEPDATDAGPIQRNIPTQLVLGTYDGTTPDVGSVPNSALATSVAATFTPTVQQSSEAWTQDRFRIALHELPQDEAESLLPVLAPHYPGDGASDSQILRHLTVYNVATAVRPLSMDGWIVAGRIAIEAGELVCDITTQPGAPTYAATPITVGEVVAATFHAHPVEDIDPRILIADLALVDA